MNKEYKPYNLSMEYGMFSVYLSKPGAWNNWAFNLFNLANLSDSSFISKLLGTYSGLDDITISADVSHHYGNEDGELKYGGQNLDLGFQLAAAF